MLGIALTSIGAVRAVFVLADHEDSILNRFSAKHNVSYTTNLEHIIFVIEHFSAQIENFSQRILHGNVSLPQQDSREYSLTARERQVVRLVCLGLSNKEIARELNGISPRTVEVHRSRAMEKLGVRNSAELAMRYSKALTSKPKNYETPATGE